MGLLAPKAFGASLAKRRHYPMNDSDAPAHDHESAHAPETPALAPASAESPALEPAAVEPSAQVQPAEELPPVEPAAEPAAIEAAPPPEPESSTPIAEVSPEAQPEAANQAAFEPAPILAEAAAEPEAPPAEAPAAAEAPAEPAAAAPARPAPPPKSPEELARIEARKQRAQAAWERVVAAHESGEVLSGTVTAAVKGGLLVDVGGIRGFLPASQVRVAPGTALDTLVRSKLPLKVIDVDQNRRRIVASHRRAAEEERRAKRAEVLNSLAVGQVREGTVVRLADFGAFVDLGGIDGLIPMRELAFERVEKAGDVVKVGETLNVEVLRIDEGGKKISLSRKNALPDPWRDHAAVLRQGSTVHGKVVGKDGRLQVEIAPGIVGTVRESDADPADYEIGEAIEVLVRRVDRMTRRITLSTLNAASAMPQPTSTGFAPLGIELGRRS